MRIWRERGELFDKEGEPKLGEQASGNKGNIGEPLGRRGRVGSGKVGTFFWFSIGPPGQRHVGESNYLQVKAILGELFHLHLSLPGGIFASSGQQLTRKSSVEWPQLALHDRQLSSYRGLIFFFFFKVFNLCGGKERVVFTNTLFLLWWSCSQNGDDPQKDSAKFWLQAKIWNYFYFIFKNLYFRLNNLTIYIERWRFFSKTWLDSGYWKSPTNFLIF